MPNLSNGQVHLSESAGPLECMKEEICSQLKLEIQSGFNDLSVKLSQEIQSLGFQGSAKPAMNKDKDCASNCRSQQEMLPPVCNADSNADSIALAPFAAKDVFRTSTTDSRSIRAQRSSTSSDISTWRSRNLWREQVRQDIEKHKPRMGSVFADFKNRGLTAIPDNCLARFVLSSWFTLLSFFLIVLNAIWMGYESDAQGERQHSPHRKWQANVNLAFTLWFIAEILLRITALRLHFFLGNDWMWNLFDLALVLSSIPGLFVGVVNMVFLRVLRLAKLSRALRLVRLVKFVTSLREILLSLFLTLGSLFWSFVAIVLTTYIFALLFMQWINLQEEEDIHYSNSVTEKFRSTSGAMLTLYSFISGGQDWYDLLKEFDHKSDFLAKTVLTFYVFLMSFGLVNVITGVFVARATEATRDDACLRVAKQEARASQRVQDLMRIFNEIDCERAGSINRDMFNAYFQNSRGQYVLQSLGLQLDDTSKLWQVLDLQDGLDDDVLDVAGFVTGVMRLSGEAKSTELVIMAMHVEEIRAILHKRCVSRPTHAPEYLADTPLSGLDLPAHYSSDNFAPTPLSGSDFGQQTPSEEDVRFAL